VRKAIFAVLITTIVIAWLAIPPGMMPTLASDRPANAEDTRARLAALARAKVFVDAGTTREETPREESPVDEIDCRFLDTPVSGTTAKFDCTLDDGARIRVKYGWTEEIHAEVAATHLLAALGFGADNVSMARRVRCHGCPRWPMFARQAAGRLHFDKFLQEHINYDRHHDFEWVSVERRGRSNELKFGDQEGWSWNELSTIDPALGGATHAEVDALRLMAMFLNHWDNKPSNQRLVCESSPNSGKPGDSDETPRCDHPLAMIQDVGSTFGPKKMNLRAWNELPFWADATNCTISMKNLPYEGSTFQDVSVSEEGRRLLADRLVQLTPSRLRALFTYARLDEVDGWVAAFGRRVDAIARRPPCPS
jgi:hypothetical protein